MFSIIKQAYACSLAPGAKIPYCDEIKDQFETTCPCINRSITIITSRSFGDRVKDILYIFKEPISLAILLIDLALVIFLTKFLYSKLINKKLKSKPILLKTISFSALFLLVFIFVTTLIIIIVSPLYGIKLL